YRRHHWPPCRSRRYPADRRMVRSAPNRRFPYARPVPGLDEVLGLDRCAVVERPVVVQRDLEMLLVVGLDRLSHGHFDIFGLRIDSGQSHEHGINWIAAASFVSSDGDQRILWRAA